MINSSKKPLSVECPTCQEKVLWTDDFPHRPFCSQRCQLVDFGDWATEKHKIESKTPDFLEGEAPNEEESI